MADNQETENPEKSDKLEALAAEAVQPPPQELRRHEDEVGLALSGGGFRAALFGLGTLWRLNDCGWLKRLSRITSVSGGSITSAYLGMNWRKLAFDANGVAQNFEPLIA